MKNNKEQKVHEVIDKLNKKINKLQEEVIAMSTHIAKLYSLHPNDIPKELGKKWEEDFKQGTQDLEGMYDEKH